VVCEREDGAEEPDFIRVWVLEDFLEIPVNGAGRFRQEPHGASKMTY